MIAETYCKTCGQEISTIVMQTDDAYSNKCINIELKHSHIKCRKCIDSGVILKIIVLDLHRGDAT